MCLGLLLARCGYEGSEGPPGAQGDAGALERVLFVSPEGRGWGSGESERDALPFDRLQRALEMDRGGLTVKLGAGVYDLDRPLVIPDRGEVWTRFLGSGAETVLRGSYWPGDEARGFAALQVQTNRVEIVEMSFQGLGACVATRPTIPSRQIRLRHLRARDVHSCIVVGRRQEAEVQDWWIDDLEVQGYYQSAIRLSGPATRNIRVTSTRLDGENSAGLNDCFMGGIQLLRGVSNIRIEDVEIRNNVGDCGDRYQQGEGIEVDHKGGAPHDIVVRRARIEASGDAGLDLKGRSITLEDVQVVRGPAQRYGIRFWTYDDYRCRSCVIEGGRVAHVGLINAGVEFRDSVFDGGPEDRGLCQFKDKPDYAPSKVTFPGSRRSREPIVGPAMGCLAPEARGLGPQS